MLKPFNPDKQRLLVHTENIYFTEALLEIRKIMLMSEIQSQLYDAVVQLLKEFHHTDDFTYKTQ